MPETPAERSAHARRAALARSAREPSGAAMLEKARETFRRSFYDATDPALPEAERQRQAEAGRRLYYSKLAQRARITVRQAAESAAALEAAVEELIAAGDSADVA